MAVTDIASRTYNHGWRLDPIVRSLLDTDFYKLLMVQMIRESYPDQHVTFSVINRSRHVRLAEIIDEVESERGMMPGTTRLIAMVETAAAFFRIAEIARAHPRLCALNLGAEDFALSAGILPDAEGLFMPKQMTVFAARAAGIMPLGFIGTVAEFHDLDGFRQTIRRSRRLGFIGASVIHPSQIPILNEEFRPGAEEVDHARRVVAAYDKALAEGVGAVTVDGKMIDVPIVERARLLLEREETIAAREARMRKTAVAVSCVPPRV